MSMLQKGFKGAFSIVPGPITLKKSMQHQFAIINVRNTVAQIISILHS